VRGESFTLDQIESHISLGVFQNAGGESVFSPEVVLRVGVNGVTIVHGVGDHASRVCVVHARVVVRMVVMVRVQVVGTRVQHVLFSQLGLCRVATEKQRKTISNKVKNIFFCNTELTSSHRLVHLQYSTARKLLSAFTTTLPNIYLI